MKRVIAGLIAALFFSPSLGAETSSVQIEVSSEWDGLSLSDRLPGRDAPIKAISIACDDAGCRWGENRPVPKSAVDSFLAQLLAEPKEELALADLGITPEKVDALTRSELEGVGRNPTITPKGYERALEQIRGDWGEIEQIVRRYYDPHTVWTDDYPSIRGRASWNGTEASFRSSAQQKFMIPWNVTVKGRAVVTYNAGLSRALGALLPSGFVNLQRLRGDHLDDWLMGEIRQEVLRRINTSKR
jgi:hypothetical protein